MSKAEGKDDDAKGCDRETKDNGAPARAEAKDRDSKSGDESARRATIMKSVCEFYFDSPELEAKMEQFAEQNCGPFDDALAPNAASLSACDRSDSYWNYTECTVTTVEAAVALGSGSALRPLLPD